MCRVLILAHPGFQIPKVHLPHSSSLQHSPHNSLQPGTQMSSHLTSQQVLVISFSIGLQTQTRLQQAWQPHLSQVRSAAPASEGKFSKNARTQQVVTDRMDVPCGDGPK
jgi:hypothetical protein